MNSAVEQLRAQDDGLPCGEVGRWAETKYRLVSLYDKLFSTGMKYKWDQRVYIDLYSGGGIARIRGTGIRLKGSPILALDLPDRFDRYIFCEENGELLNALQQRCEVIAPGCDAKFIAGKCDDKVEEIFAAIPKWSPGNKVLSLCLVDPFDFGIKFETIRSLSRCFVDFLVLLAVGMDANRNYDHYVDGDHPKIDEALGNIDWRNRWRNFPGGRSKFRDFLAIEFALSMRTLGYQEVKLHQMKQVRSDEKNLPLYYLALFSRHSTAYQFWDEVLEYSTDQTSFNWG